MMKLSDFPKTVSEASYIGKNAKGKDIFRMVTREPTSEDTKRRLQIINEFNSNVVKRRMSLEEKLLKDEELAIFNGTLI